MIDIKSSIRIVLGCSSGYRIPEPLRRADILTKELKRKLLKYNYEAA
jgi:deoxyinosine 3'endonuclease (endonuclease V)